jgi:hypothetical protein
MPPVPLLVALRHRGRELWRSGGSRLGLLLALLVLCGVLLSLGMGPGGWRGLWNWAVAQLAGK